MPKLARKPGHWFILKEQVRKCLNEEELRSLGESMKERQLEPVGALADGTVIYGERRVRAAILVGIDVDVLIYDEALSEAQIKVIQLTENIHRSDLTGYEKWQACAELLALNPDWTNKALAERLKLHESQITRLLSPSKSIPTWREALREGKVGIGDIYAASKLPPEQQAELLAAKLNGASRDDLEREGRKRRNGSNGDKPAPRANRIRIDLSGVTVTFVGQQLSLEAAIEAAADAGKLMKKGQEQGLTAKTIQKISVDRAKAEGRS